jgi:hypothetical protein
MIMDGIFRHAKNTIPSEQLLRDITDIFLCHSDTEFPSTVFSA